MSKIRSNTKITEHKNNSINILNSYIEQLISSDNLNDSSKADKLCYWIDDYVNFLNFESNFKPTSYKAYSRGDIIKLHLGFNIGSEEGGLHYAVVLNNKLPLSSPVVNIAPLTSKKDSYKPNRPGFVDIGTDLYTKINDKLTKTKNDLDSYTAQLDKEILNVDDPNSPSVNELVAKAEFAMKYQEDVQKTLNEFKNMKSGSIVLTNQITTISKIRIYNPKTSNDSLHGIRLSNESLDLIDRSISSLYTYHPTK